MSIFETDFALQVSKSATTTTLARTTAATSAIRRIATELNHTNANTKLPIPKTEPLNFFPQYQLPPLCSPEPKRQRLESPPVIPQSSLARQRRQKLSEKTQKPWE